MERQRGFDNVKREKEKAIARFNRFRRIAKLWRFVEVLAVFAVISWLSRCSTAVLRFTCVSFLDFSNYLSNYHVVFLIGNAIILLLFMLSRQNGSSVSAAASGSDLVDFYDNYVKCIDAARQREVDLPSSLFSDCYSPEKEYGVGGGDDEKQILVEIHGDYLKYSEAAHQREVALSPIMEESHGYDEKQIVVRAQETEAIPRSDDVAAAIEKAAREIERFRRTQSEKLKREISVRPRMEFRRSETDNHLKTVSCRPTDTSEIETLNNDEFRRRVDAFIVKHWSGRTKQIQFGEYENYGLTF